MFAGFEFSRPFLAGGSFRWQFCLGFVSERFSEDLGRNTSGHDVSRDFAKSKRENQAPSHTSHRIQFGKREKVCSLGNAGNTHIACLSSGPTRSVAFGDIRQNSTESRIGLTISWNVAYIGNGKLNTFI